MTPTIENAFHAAETWLQRVAAPAEALCIVTLRPTASVGHWTQGQQHVQTLAVDESGAELCEAVAPAALACLERLSPDVLDAAMARSTRDARLQLILMPQSRELSLRVADGVQQVTLITLANEESTH